MVCVRKSKDINGIGKYIKELVAKVVYSYMMKKESLAGRLLVISENEDVTEMVHGVMDLDEANECGLLDQMEATMARKHINDGEVVIVFQRNNLGLWMMFESKDRK